MQSHPIERAMLQHSRLSELYFRCRQQSVELIGGLGDADLTVQSMEDASPGKWHLAHTSWFFEEFVLTPHLSGYAPFETAFRFLFNSYYETIGPRHPRPQRGLLSRPALDQVLAYRQAVDAAVARLFENGLPAEAATLIELGMQHEQQHQELLLTDLLHLFAQNPLKPTVREMTRVVNSQLPPAAARWVEFDGGRVAIGHAGDNFSFDCERPRHDVLLQPYALSSRPVSNGEWRDFIADGGYRNPLLWLSDGWHCVQAGQWQAPLYWSAGDGEPRQMTLTGEQPIDLDAPVSQISYFEADAFARWVGCRLPTEAEWEAAAAVQPVAGNFADSKLFRPASGGADVQTPLQHLYGDVWEWTASAFCPYPGFRAAPGAIGEYNGKFMSGQYVLRGGSCVTPAGHVRATYRNFFQPHQRWQFSGVRLARNHQ